MAVSITAFLPRASRVVETTAKSRLEFGGPWPVGPRGQIPVWRGTLTVAVDSTGTKRAPAY